MWRSGDPNPEPLDCRSSALPTELAQSVEHSTGNREVRGSDPRNVTFIGLPYDWNHRLLTVASVCSPFYAEVLLTYISRSLSQRNNTYFQSKEQWHPAEDPINSWRSSSIGRALDRQSRGSGFGSPERHIYRVTVWLKSSTANRGKRMLALLRWSTINLHLTPGYGVSPPSVGQGGGGGGVRPPLGVSNRSVVELSGKDQQIALAEYSRLVVLFLVLGQYLTQLWQVKGQIFGNSIIFQLYESISWLEKPGGGGPRGTFPSGPH